MTTRTPTGPDRYPIFAITCPFHGNRQWRHIRDTSPTEWADVIAFDHAIRHGHPAATDNGQPLRGEYFLHHSRVPLDQADLDRANLHRAEPDLPHSAASVDATSQGDQDEAAGDGADPDGCSPWACRSGHPADAPSTHRAEHGPDGRRRVA